MSATNLTGASPKLADILQPQTIIYVNIWNYHLLEHMKLSPPRTYETIAYLKIGTTAYLNISNYHLPEHMKLSPTWTYETVTYLNIWNYHLPEHMKLSTIWTYETITYLNTWNYCLPERMKLSPLWTYETITYLNIWNYRLSEHMKQMWESLHKIFTSVSTFSNHVTNQGGHQYRTHFNQTTPVSPRSVIKVCAPSSNNVFSKNQYHFPPSFAVHNSQHPNIRHLMLSQKYTSKGS
jgi:hypothetical protein